MTHVRCTFLAILFLSISNSFPGYSAMSDTCHAVKQVKEKFEDFFERFCYEEEFQLSRIKFPLETIRLNDDTYDYDTVYVEKGEWKFSRFDYYPDKDARSQIYDNFMREMRDSNERVFEWRGIGNGIKDFYYFKRINGIWYLIKEEDFST